LPRLRGLFQLRPETSQLCQDLGSVPENAAVAAMAMFHIEVSRLT